MADSIPVDEWINLPKMINETYLNEILKGIYYNVGKKGF